MALDAVAMKMIAGRVRGAAILCLGYPDITASREAILELLRVEPTEFTNHGADHKVARRLPETLHTFSLAGAAAVDVVDAMPSRGCERQVDLNERQTWPREYDLVINPGTLEHCFDVATAMFNAWRALRPGGAVLHVAPMTMLNHGFWNFSPTAIEDFASANGGRVVHIQARDREARKVPIDPVRRFRAAPEAVLYAVVEKTESVPETIPVQWRYRQ